MENLLKTPGNSREMSYVLIMLSTVLQLNNLSLSKWSRVSAAKIRFVRIRTIHSGQWTRPSYIMEPVKRFSQTQCQEMHFAKHTHPHHFSSSFPVFHSTFSHLFLLLAAVKDLLWSAGPSSSDLTFTFIPTAHFPSVCSFMSAASAV